MNRLPQSSVDEGPEVLLRRFFQRSGYVRVADQARRKELKRDYRRGYEVRLVAKTRTELMQIRQLVRQVGFDPATTFVKHNRIVQPIYGKAAVEWFLSTSVE